MAELSAKKLGLHKADLPNSIIEVIATLNQQGFEAYIVGGGVRDNLLGLNPKDFDAVTDAKPFEVKDVFGKRCRIIGRRFQLAHVYSGRDMIEVATFRAPPNDNAHTTTDGMIVRDNVWGDIEQDFARRDFSINALYYQPVKGVVHDFCDAMSDIKSKTLRLLGHAPVRIEEDPVRLLRALRFKAKLGFEFDAELSEQFNAKNWALLEQVSPHRLYDETQKMFTGGYLVPLLPLLFEYGAIEHLIVYPPNEPSRLVNQVAINTDKRIESGKSINPAFFYAALLWDNYLYQLNKNKERGMNFADAQVQAAIKVIERQRNKTAIPKFSEQFIRDIWLMQPKLAAPRVKQISQLAEHPRFRAGFDFLLLREQCDDELNPLSESTNGMGEWWQTYQTLTHKEQQKAIDEFANQARRSNRSDRTEKNKQRQQESNLQASDQPKSERQGVNQQQSKASAKNSDAKQRQTQAKRHRPSEQALKERELLQKLSLGKIAGDADTSIIPKPLFQVSAEKLAKQLSSGMTLEELGMSDTQRNAQPSVNQEVIDHSQATGNSHATDDTKSAIVKSNVQKPASPFIEQLLMLDSVPPERQRKQVITEVAGVAKLPRNQSPKPRQPKNANEPSNKPKSQQNIKSEVKESLPSAIDTPSKWLQQLLEQGERVPQERRRRTSI